MYIDILNFTYIYTYISLLVLFIDKFMKFTCDKKTERSVRWCLKILQTRQKILRFMAFQCVCVCVFCVCVCVCLSVQGDIYLFVCLFVCLLLSYWK